MTKAERRALLIGELRIALEAGDAERVAQIEAEMEAL